MKPNDKSKIIYGHDTIEFVTVAVEYCAFLEKSEGRSRDDFYDTVLKLLPLLYVKAQLLPSVESEGDFLPQAKVTEDDYNWIRRIVYDIVTDEDQYLDISYENVMETDETQWKSLSEHLADIYQPLRNFLAVYQDGTEDCMFDALWAVKDSFELYWGLALVDAMKRLHYTKYSRSDSQPFDAEYDD